MRITRVWPTVTIERDKRHKANDDVYCAWLRKQKSAFSGKAWCQACHYRTAANSGIGIKPLFQAIPLTREEHATQHRIGTFKFAPRTWWVAQVTKYQTLFIQQGGKIPDKYLVENHDGK